MRGFETVVFGDTTGDVAGAGASKRGSLSVFVLDLGSLEGLGSVTANDPARRRVGASTGLCGTRRRAALFVHGFEAGGDGRGVELALVRRGLVAVGFHA